MLPSAWVIIVCVERKQSCLGSMHAICFNKNAGIDY